MTLDELLDMNGYDFKYNTKLFRHATDKNDVNKIYQDGFIEEYQGIQKSDIFHWIKDENGRDRKDKCKYIISFLGIKSETEPIYRGEFIGIYEIIGVEKIYDVPDNISSKEIKREYENCIGGYLYKFSKINILDKYKNNLVIDWGKSPRTICQWLGKRSSSGPKKVID